MSKIWRNGLLAASLCLNVGFLSALGVHVFQHRRPSGMPDLNLSPEAKDKLDSNFRAFKDRLGGLNAQVLTERVRMLDLLASQDPSPEAIRAQQERITGLTGQILQATSEHLLVQKSLLSPEQQRIFFDHIRHRIQDADRRSPFP